MGLVRCGAELAVPMVCGAGGSSALAFLLSSSRLRPFPSHGSGGERSGAGGTDDERSWGLRPGLFFVFPLAPPPPAFRAWSGAERAVPPPSFLPHRGRCAAWLEMLDACPGPPLILAASPPRSLSSSRRRGAGGVLRSIIPSIHFPSSPHPHRCFHIHPSSPSPQLLSFVSLLCILSLLRSRASTGPLQFFFAPGLLSLEAAPALSGSAHPHQVTQTHLPPLGNEAVGR